MSARDLVPQCPPIVLYSALIPVILLTAFLSGSWMQNHPPLFAPPVFAASYVVDRLVLNILSLAITAWIVASSIGSRVGRSSIRDRVSILVFVTIALAIILMSAYLFEQLVLKPAFAIYRAPTTGQETFLVAWVRRTFGPDTNSTPSGFMFRQMILFWCTLVYATRRHPNGSWSLIPLAAPALWAQAGLTVVSSLVSVGRGIHRPLDIGLAIACSFFFFVSGYYTISFFLGAGRRELNRLVVTVLLTLGPILFFYSGSAVEWTTIILIVTGLVALPDFISSRFGGT